MSVPTPNLPAFVSPEGADVLLHVKAVPGAKADQIVGELGSRLKVRVAAPPEGGKANRAICDLIAGALKVKASSVLIERGQSSAEKTIRVRGCGLEQVASALLGQRKG
jgi:uncharacterized protein